MSQRVKEVMTKNPFTLPATSSATEAAKAMRDNDIGNVLVEENGKICGLLTDRDIVVRSVAEGKDPARTQLGSICSRDLTSLSPDDDVDNAVELMRKKAIRRIPVIENGKPVGILALGDLAIERDRRSALGGISEARPNH